MFITRVQQILGEVEFHSFEPLRPGHSVAVAEHRSVVPVGTHVGKVCELEPEGLALLDRPPMERGVVGEFQSAPRLEALHEAGEVRRLASRLTRPPERLFRHR